MAPREPAGHPNQAWQIAGRIGQPWAGPAPVRGHTHQQAATLQPTASSAPRVPANGPMWRLRSLIAMGHPTGRITTALAASAHVIEPLIRGDRATITPALAGDIARLFEAWWDKHPPRNTPAEKAAACKALQRAAAHDWPCPAGLDDDELDQPGYTPAASWRYAHGTGTATADPLGKHHHPHHPPRVGRAAEPGRAAG
jgi:hypothetical protein